MSKTFEYLYYLKTLYLNAGKNMLTDNYQYYKNLINSEKIVSLAKRIKPGEHKAVQLCDDTGCRADAVIQAVKDMCEDNNNIYTIEDDLCNDKLAAIYCSEIFIVHDMFGNCYNLPSYNLDFCYNGLQRRKYTSKQYQNIAQYYYEKSECIENNICL